MKKTFFWILLIILVSIPAIAALLPSGFFLTDDGEWMIIRFSSFYQSFADGQFPVRFLTRLNHEYGYPVANFLYPGFMYLGIPIHVLGFGFVDTVKIIFSVSMVVSTIFCYLWLSRFFDKFSSFVGSIFYLYTPYHLFDLYKRGSVGEVLALAILPSILWQMERKNLFLSSIGIAFLIISHNTLAVLFLGLIILYMSLDIYISKDKKQTLKKYLLMVMFGLGISAFFWIPAFLELQYTIFSQTQVSNWGNYFANLNLIGVSTLFVLLLTIIFFLTGRIKISKHRLTVLLLIIGIMSVIFSSSLSTALWNIFPVSFIQFPFRLLSLAIVSVSFLIACVISVSPKKLKIPIIVLSLIFLVLSAKPFLTPSEFFDKGEGFYATNMDTTTVKNEYMPKWVKQNPVERNVEKVEIVEGIGIVNNISYDSKKISFNIEARDDIKVRINTVYYPGWKVYIDNKESQIYYENEKGVMDISVLSGNHVVEASFVETPMRLLSDMISLVSVFTLLAFILIESKRKLIGRQKD